MRDALRHRLRCPRCRAQGDFTLDARERDEREVREGALRCRGCGARYEIRRGVVDLLHDPPEHVRREADGLGRFAARMREEGWDRERVLRLPREDSGYWFVQEMSFARVLHSTPFEPGQRVLDIGANTCWASAKLAERGLDVVALDIAAHELQGLDTADWWIEDRGVYFERVLGTMFDLPLADASLDYVYCCEVLHHNDARGLRATMREIHRVLRPGGMLLAINEELRGLRNRKPDHGAEVAEYEGHEHAFFLPRYWLAARAAGFDVSIEEPPYHRYFAGEPYELGPHTTAGESFRAALLNASRRSRRGRRLYLAYRNLVAADVALNMTCVKRG